MAIDTRIFYVLLIPDDDARFTSPFQGFSPGILELTWALRLLVRLPADVYEFALPHQAVLSRRIAGTGGWSWMPLALRALPDLRITPAEPFWVFFSHDPEMSAAFNAWAPDQPVAPLHVVPQGRADGLAADQVTPESIRDHVKASFDRARTLDAGLDPKVISECIENWQPRPRNAAPILFRGHNCTLPNHMALEGAGFIFDDGEPFVGRTNQDYASIIVESAQAVLDVRRRVGTVPGFKSTPPWPDVILTAPSLYRHAYKLRLKPDEERFQNRGGVHVVLTQLQRQRNYTWSLTAEQMKQIVESRDAMITVQFRQQELELHTLAVGLRGASTLAATFRLPPAVNRGAGVIQQLTRHVRAGRVQRKQKLVRLFRAVQDELRNAIGPELLELIAKSSAGIKLVTDAPLEWLPIGDLPLGLRFNVSRITSTPGNLLVGALSSPAVLRLSHRAFEEVLIVSAFTADDSIRDEVPRALSAFKGILAGKVDVRIVNVQGVNDLVETLNAYRGALMVFDGHGRHSDDRVPGVLEVCGEQLDPWTLRERARLPPIVLLSACDTLAVDGSHASAANGLLAAGARTVIGTLLPLNAVSAASFVARLMYRLADFIPAALNAYDRALQWTEVVGGMLRMQLVTDIITPLRRANRITPQQWRNVQELGNRHINALNLDWLEVVVRAIAEELQLSPDIVREHVQSVIPTSDTIRYVQVGNPESILIDDETRIKRFEEAFAAFNH